LHAAGQSAFAQRAKKDEPELQPAKVEILRIRA
jgi:hypothetical protein